MALTLFRRDTLQPKAKIKTSHRGFSNQRAWHVSA